MNFFRRRLWLWWGFCSPPPSTLKEEDVWIRKCQLFVTLQTGCWKGFHEEVVESDV